MELLDVPAKKTILFEQDEARQTRDISTKLNGMAANLSKMVRGGDLSISELDVIMKELIEPKHELDKFFEELLVKYNSLK